MINEEKTYMNLKTMRFELCTLQLHEQLHDETIFNFYIKFIMHSNFR